MPYSDVFLVWSRDRIRYTSASLCSFAPTCALILQCGGLKAVVKRLQCMPPPPRDMIHMAACTHALACVGGAAGQEMFRAAAGDVVAVGDPLCSVLFCDIVGRYCW